MSLTRTQQFTNGLKSKNAEFRMKTARDLYHFVRTELREMSPEELAAFLDDFNHIIFEMVSSNDVNEKKGGILAIVCLIGADVGNTNNRISRFALYLRNLLPSSDVGVMELAAKTVGKITLTSGSCSAGYVDFEVKRAFEWLSGDRHEGKRHAAVLILRELAVAVPTYFFQQVQQFFDHIFIVMRDPKPAIRETGAEALRAALVVTAQRETAKQTQKPQWYKNCYEEACMGLDEMLIREKGINRDDYIHGSLLVLNELFRVSNVHWERYYEELMQKLEFNQSLSLGDAINVLPPLKSPLSIKKNKQPVMSSLGFGLSLGGTSSGNQLGMPEATLLHESSVCRALLSEHFDEVCSNILSQRISRNIYIQQILPKILPRLAAFNREKFIKNHLNASMVYLLSTLRSKDRDRSLAFTTIGLIAVAVEENIKPHLPKIMEVIRASLPSKEGSTKKRMPNLDPSVFICITLLGHAVKNEIKNDVKELLELMLSTGLSSSLTIALRELATNIPALKKDISEGLLGMLSKVLMNKQFRHPGMPANYLPSSSNSSSMSTSTSTAESDVPSIVLALRTLGSFNFDGHSLLQFVCRCADHFLSSEQRQVRIEAVHTCSRLLRLAIESSTHQHSETVVTTVADVLGKLLMVAITDTDAEVRLSVFESLDESFDHYLAQYENLNALFVGLNDESFEIREMSLCVVGRLSYLNPAYVMPSLRKTLIQVLAELEHSGMGRNKEQSARMLDHLAVNAPRLLRPYMQPILKILVPKLKELEPNPGVLISVLTCVGDLAQVNGSEMKQWTGELMPILLEMLGDASSPEKRGVALWVLGQLVEATGYVVQPYNEYPALLDVLLNFLKTEQQPIIRREAIRVLGLLGALDPYKHKMNLGQIDSTMLLSTADTKSEIELGAELTTSEMLINMSSSSLEEYYPAVAIATLMKIIKDPTLSQHHTMVVQAVTFIVKSLGVKCVPYIQQVMPGFLNVIRTSEINFRDFLFQQLATLIVFVKQHIRNYLEDIFKLVKEFWIPGSPLQNTLILLVEHIALALGSEFKVYLPYLMPHILRVFTHDTSKDKSVTVKMLGALQKFGNTLEEYLHMILPPVVKLFDAHEVPVTVSKTAIQTIDLMAETLDFTDYASRIIHPLIRSIEAIPKLQDVAMDLLCTLVLQLQQKYKIFIPLVNRTLSRHSIVHPRYEFMVNKILSSNVIGIEEEKDSLKQRKLKQKKADISATQSETTIIKKIHTSVPNLQTAWTANRRVSKDDWMEWLKRLSIGLLKESPSPALRSCWALAQTYTPLSRDLFNAAFVSCWTVLTSSVQQELIHTLEQALMVPDLPEITQTILNLAEFMEHCEKGPLPLDPQLLGERAIHCRAYAKALHYKEDEFHKGPTSQVIESLISINNKLQQKEAAAGLLNYVMNHKGDNFKVQERWYEKLNRWDTALKSYEERLQENPNDSELSLGRMRCLEALGEWTQLNDVANQQWNLFPETDREKMSRMASAAAWGLGQWDAMDRYVNCIPRDTTDGAFYRAVLCVHKDQFIMGQKFIDSARELLDTELAAMAGESYQRAYGAMVSVQMLAELEEVIQYKLIPDRRPTIRKIWWDRLQGCQRVVEDWQRIIQVRTLVIPPQQDMHTWLKYASLCRKSSKLMLSHKTLKMLLNVENLEDDKIAVSYVYPQVTFAFCKHLWESDKKTEAYNQLSEFVEKFQQHQGVFFGPQDDKQQDMRRRFLARCYLKLGQWQENLQGTNENSIMTVLQYYSLSTDHDTTWYKAWHSWAYMNFEAVLFYKQFYSQQNSTETKYISDFAVPSVSGFFKSIALSHGNSLQDTLRLLTLWFDYGQHSEVCDAIVDGIKTIEIDTWLQVIPQLIARIDTQRVLVGRIIHHLLFDIGKHHPQALVYPLTVASKSASSTRHNAANKILKSMCEHSSTLVQQAVMVSDELIRVAILWHELWHEGLEEASRLYFGERNVKGMFETLQPLHNMLERGPQTLKETSFNQAYGRDLVEAMEWCNRYKVSGNIRDLNQAWDLYYHVFRRISRQLPQLTSLELQYVSPKLLMCRDLELAVPGSYVPGQPVIKIAYIQSALQVITSKQRPRKLCIKGSNGNDYMFLLKGHEDLRQDERVMQLFGLVNTLLLNDPKTFRHNLTIQRYAVIPLSTNSGLIGWVPHCDTLHTLIRDYRDKKKILLNIEHRIMLRMAPDYDHLTLMQKVEVFEHALDTTQGDDLAKLLWLKSPSSEVWFDRRTNYTRSLAVMSMVGYILGLGDRHPSNLMLDRLSGKILHIDFGDCFEVAMTREKFPEKIPFRLTRMLINAMEVTGIDGTYRKTCESVMSVLHRNKDSLMAVLEAFVYDPLLNWRLIEGGGHAGANGIVVVRSSKGSNSTPSAPSVSAVSEAVNSDADTLSDAAANSSLNIAKKQLSESSGEAQQQPEALNKKALVIITRVREKLTGHDFDKKSAVSVEKQVELLIKQATSNENLCQCYIGWCPFW
ncbi:serine/threonine-protein kinase mTOR isoform X2 [Planococcus citri]|uniref:serine/threonine-protein kinase mTOR isoform X2 n=1 Tax=Planococcus citri TaxID=170843 RepID=UPI0031F884DD